MTSLTPKSRKSCGYRVHLAANTPWHPDHEEAKTRLAELAGVKPELVAESAPISRKTTDLKRFESVDGIELVIDTRTGEAFATQGGYARMSGLTKQAISKRCNQGVNQSEIKNDEIETPGGIQGVNLIPAKLVYRWLTKDNPELSIAMGEAGATIYLHQLAGFKVSSTATEPIAQPEPQPTPPQTPQLPPADIRVTNLTNALDKLGINLQNPRFKQGLQDLTLDILGIGQTAFKNENNEVWCGVVERAEQMGYPASVATKHNIKLGQAITKFGLKSRKEDRLCNGTQRPINIYLVCDELDEAIFSYFSRLKIFP